MGLEHSINDFTRITACLHLGMPKIPQWSKLEGKVATDSVRSRGALDDYINQLARNISLISDLRATLNKPLPAPAEGQEENPELPIKRDELKAELNTLENQMNKDLAVARDLSDSLNDRSRASQSTLKNYAEQLQEMARRALSLMPGIKDLDKSTINDMGKLLTVQNREEGLKKLAASRDPSGTVGLGKIIEGVVAETKEGAKEFKDRQDNELKRAMSYLDSVVKQVKALETRIADDNRGLRDAVAKTANFFKADPQTAAQIQGMHDQIDKVHARRAVLAK